MKSSTPIFKILSVAVLVAVVLYFAGQLRNYLKDPMTTTMIYNAAVEDTISVNGYLVREEETFSSSAETLSHEQEEGAKVGIGQTMAVAYGNSGALDLVAQIESLELQLQQLQFALESYLDPDAALKLDGTINEDLLTIQRCIVDGDYAAMSEEVSAMKAGVMKRDYTYTTKEDIEADIADTQSKIQQCKAGLSQVENICAPRSGTYSAVCDGYETVLKPEMLAGLTCAQLEAVAPTDASNANVGKLIYGDRWYYAAVISEEDAQLLAKKSQIVLRFAKGIQYDLAMSVDHITKAENGQCLLVVYSDKYLAQTTTLRHQAGELILRSYEGLRVPSNALRVNEEGISGVYCVVGITARFKPVEVIHQRDDYVLVKPADDAQGTAVLRIGDEVIATAGELYDGKVVG